MLSETSEVTGSRSADQRGAAAPMLVLFTIALFAVAGLVIDGGYALGAKREAMSGAEQAARAGSDALSDAALRSGRTEVDPRRATTAAQEYLSQAGLTGTVSVAAGRVTVSVKTEQPTTMLAIVGVSSIPVTARASAVSINDQDGATR